MINNVVLVGRVCNEVNLFTNENGYKAANIVLAVQRGFKNQEDVYETDFIDVKVTFMTAEICAEYITKGSIIGIKGRLATKTLTIGDKKINAIEMIGERVTFIHLLKKNEEVDAQ